MKLTISYFLITPTLSMNPEEEENKENTKIDPIIVMSGAFLILFIFVLFYSLDRKSVVNSISNNTPTLTNECIDLPGVVVQNDNTNQIVGSRHLFPEDLIEKYSIAPSSKSLVSNSETLELVNENSMESPLIKIKSQPEKIESDKNLIKQQDKCNDLQEILSFESGDTLNASLEDNINITDVKFGQNIKQITPVENSKELTQGSDNCLLGKDISVEYDPNTPAVVQICTASEIEFNHTTSLDQQRVSSLINDNTSNNQTDIEDAISKKKAELQAEKNKYIKSLEDHLKKARELGEKTPKEIFSLSPSEEAEMVTYQIKERNKAEHIKKLNEWVYLLQEPAYISLHGKAKVEAIIQAEYEEMNEIVAKYYDGLGKLTGKTIPIPVDMPSLSKNKKKFDLRNYIPFVKPKTNHPDLTEIK